MATPKRDRRVLQKPTENHYDVSFTKKEDLPNRIRSHTLVANPIKPIPITLNNSFKGRAPEFTES